jgi:hypothetical protein
MSIHHQPTMVVGYREEGGGVSPLVITRRWFRAKHYIFLATLLVATAFVAYLWAKHGAGVALVIGTLLLVQWDYALLTMLLNRTTVRADQDRVQVDHGPLPFFFKKRSLPREDIAQLFAAGDKGRFAVKAKLADGSTATLVEPLVRAEQALFVEQELERTLGIVDYSVPEELDAMPAPIAAPGTSAAKGGALLGLLGPAIAIVGVALFVMLSSTDVSGELKARGELGDWTFTPDDCSSGQPEGFFGVELRSESESRRIRFAKDAVRGGLLTIEEGGVSPRVIQGNTCKSFELTVERTSTTVNDVRVLDGKATVDCETMSGSVTFEGCH